MRRLLRKMFSTFFYLILPEEGEGTVRILTYHRVNAVSPGDRLSVTPDAFRMQMAFLSEHGYRTITPEALFAMLREGKRPTRLPTRVRSES